VLGVINSSPGDLAPVFDAMLEKTLRLCEAAHGNFLTYDGEVFHTAAFRGEPQIAEYRRQLGPLRPAEFSQLARVVRGGGTLHRIDAREGEAYRDDPAYRQMVDSMGIRTSLTVPLRKGDALLGAVRAYRREVRPFTDKQIALVENFAAQAVIAMENARLLGELRQRTGDLEEALDQQTATAEVLGVINSSPGELAPVFDAMLEKATRICEGAFGVLATWDGERFHRVAFQGLPPDLVGLLQQPVTPVPGGIVDRLVRGEIINTADLREADYPRGPGAEALLRRGARSCAHVPLRKDDALLGAIVVYRQEVRPFSDKQIALLQNFAAQAVIAMENARLITETREALEQQTATAEVLGVINSSPGASRLYSTRCSTGRSHCAAPPTVCWQPLTANAFTPWLAAAIPSFTRGSVSTPRGLHQERLRGLSVARTPCKSPTSPMTRSSIGRLRAAAPLSTSAVFGLCWPSRYAKTKSCWVFSTSTAGKCGGSQRSRSRSCRTSPRRQ
jgi:GAF domain-containing protein